MKEGGRQWGGCSRHDKYDINILSVQFLFVCECDWS